MRERIDGGCSVVRYPCARTGEERDAPGGASIFSDGIIAATNGCLLTEATDNELYSMPA